MLERTHCLAATFTTCDKQEILRAVDQASATAPVRAATPNPEMMLEATRNPVFRESLRAMTHCVIDGTGLHWALLFSRFLTGQPATIPARYQGADLVHDLFFAYQKGEKRFFLLGGEPGLVEKTRDTLLEQYPGLAIVGAESGG